MKAISFNFRRFFGGFRCVLVQLLLIQTLFSVQFYIRRKAILFSVWQYDYCVCRINRFRVMIDFLRDSSTTKHFDKWFERGHD